VGDADPLQAGAAGWTDERRGRPSSAWREVSPPMVAGRL